MLRGDDVAAVIDFAVPTPRFLAWEIARIGCDPRTVMLGDQWLDGLPDLLAAYREEHPAVNEDDLRSVVATGCAYTLASTYPLSEPLDDPDAVTPSLELYARARHDAALTMLRRLPDARHAVQDAISRVF
jgi:homoserine kinase type II